MIKAELIPKKNSVICTVAKPPAQTKAPQNIDPTTGEVLGIRMLRDSQENIDSWCDLLCDMLEECGDIPRRRRQPRRRVA